MKLRVLAHVVGIVCFMIENDQDDLSDCNIPQIFINIGYNYWYLLITFVIPCHNSDVF